ncbi:tyrosine--tRNA ligase, partial [Candidatus Peregrinibacteria bacterium CG11_big_fil_rev_8_21_14_0_20_41_10]
LVEQGGVRIDDEKIEDIETEIDLSSERVLRVGKRQFKRIVYVETAA